VSRKSPEYYKQHRAVYAARGKASDYECSSDNCEREAAEWAQIHDLDPENVASYQPMCRSCHREYDDHWDDETKAKLGATLKEMWSDPAYKEAHEMSEEQKQKLKEAWVRRRARGNPISQEARDKIAATHRGVKRSEETKAKMRASQLARRERDRMVMSHE
jgi:hypothetical protein